MGFEQPTSEVGGECVTVHPPPLHTEKYTNMKLISWALQKQPVVSEIFRIMLEGETVALYLDC